MPQLLGVRRIRADRTQEVAGSSPASSMPICRTPRGGPLGRLCSGTHTQPASSPPTAERAAKSPRRLPSLPVAYDSAAVAADRGWLAMHWPIAVHAVLRVSCRRDFRELGRYDVGSASSRSKARPKRSVVRKCATRDRAQQVTQCRLTTCAACPLTRSRSCDLLVRGADWAATSVLP
jgi:hypothetical protein